MAVRFKEVRCGYMALYDCAVRRVMVGDAHGREYYCFIEDGRGYRDRRDSVLEAIEEAIARGDEPGEVSVMGLWPVYAPPPPKPQGRAPDASESIRYEPVPGS